LVLASVLSVGWHVAQAGTGRAGSWAALVWQFVQAAWPVVAVDPVCVG
jgi:hypothetical protein